MPEPLLHIDNLSVSFGTSLAVDGASLTVHAGRTHALVGESGSGKSVTAMSVLGLVPSPPARVDSGRILYHRRGQQTDLLTAERAALRHIRGGEIAMIFQEPMTSLNPVLTVGQQIIEAVRLHRTERGKKPTNARARQIAIDALESVGIRDAAARIDDYPHQYSGGMRQRVMIAMALACEPRVLLADEPTTALDVTVQAQILSLIDDLRNSRDLGVLLITHDLGVVASHADEVSVMYAGRIVESGPAERIFQSPAHPYTRGLLACTPSVEGDPPGDAPLPLVSDAFQGDDALRIDTRADGSRLAWWPTDAPRAPGDSEMIALAPDHHVRCAREPAGTGA